jgi:hypothetical protein
MVSDQRIFLDPCRVGVISNFSAAWAEKIFSQLMADQEHLPNLPGQQICHHSKIAFQYHQLSKTKKVIKKNMNYLPGKDLKFKQKINRCGAKWI